MEPQTCFNLNDALDCWRRTLAAEPTLTPDARRELEAHVCDTVAEMRARGLNEEEAFCLARRRVGRLPELAQEFCKIDPRVRARQQVLWMAVAMLGLNVLSIVSNIITNICIARHWYWYSPFGFFRVVPALAVVYLAQRERRPVWQPRSRTQFAVVAATIIAALEILCLEVVPIFNGSVSFVKIPFLELAFYSLWPAALIALIAWLMPACPVSAEEPC